MYVMMVYLYVKNDETKWIVTLTKLIPEDIITKARNENEITCNERKGENCKYLAA